MCMASQLAGRHAATVSEPCTAAASLTSIGRHDSAQALSSREPRTMHCSSSRLPAQTLPTCLHSTAPRSSCCMAMQGRLSSSPPKPASPQHPSAPQSPAHPTPLSQSKPSWLPYLHSGLSGLAHSHGPRPTSPRVPSPPPGFGSGLLRSLQSDFTGHATAGAAAPASCTSDTPPERFKCCPAAAAASLVPDPIAQSIGHMPAGAPPSPDPPSHAASPMLSDLPAGLDLDVPWPGAMQTHVGEMDNQFVPSSFIQSLSPLPSLGHAAALAPALSHPALHGAGAALTTASFVAPNACPANLACKPPRAGDKPICRSWCIASSVLAALGGGVRQQGAPPLTATTSRICTFKACLKPRQRQAGQHCRQLLGLLLDRSLIHSLQQVNP